MERPRPGMDESLLGGEPPPLFSTQQRMLLVGHCTCNDKVLSKEKVIFPAKHLLKHGVTHVTHACVTCNNEYFIKEKVNFLAFHLLEDGVTHEAGEGVDALARAGRHVCSLCHRTQEPCNAIFTWMLFGEGYSVWEMGTRNQEHILRPKMRI